MRSNFLSGNPGLRKALPWLMWGAVAAVAIPLAYHMSGVGTSPAMVDAKIVLLSAPRTRQRLTVAEVLVVPGQTVKAGQLLIRMNTGEIDAELAVAKAKLAQLELQAKAQEVKIIDEYARFTQTFATTAERASLEMSRVYAEQERDRSELSQLELAIAREQKLVNDQLASAEYLNSLKVKHAALSKKVVEYQAAVRNAKKGASGSTKRLGDWKNASKANAATESSRIADRVAPALAAVETQRQEVRHLESQRNSHFLKAPFAGKVGEVFLKVGQISANPDEPIVTVVEENPRMAIAYVAQAKALQVKVGDPAQLVPRDLSGPRLSGKVIALAPSITEVPLRFRRVPNVHEWGRTVYIQLDSPGTLPGQGFDAIFGKGSGEAR